MFCAIVNEWSVDMGKLSIIFEFWQFLKHRKKWWLLPYRYFSDVARDIDSVCIRLSLGPIYLCALLTGIGQH